MVGFHVALSHDQTSSGKVTFNRVLSNYGNGWNSITHTYKVPIKGLYFLTLTIMNQGNSNTYVYLRPQSTNLQTVYAGYTHANVGTQSTVRMLDKGDHIYAQLGAGGRLHGNSNMYTHLAGFLIQQTK